MDPLGTQLNSNQSIATNTTQNKLIKNVNTETSGNAPFIIYNDRTVSWAGYNNYKYWYTKEKLIELKSS
jgi:hypothetical protein